MDLLNIAGISLIAGFILVILASSVSPPRLYQEPDSQLRLEIIDDHPGRWLASNVLFGLGSLTTAAGLILFSFYVQDKVIPWVNWLAALTYSLGTVLWLLFLYNRQVNPAHLFENYTFSPFTLALIALLLTSFLLYGVVYTQTGFPGWLGYVTAGLTLLITSLAIFFPSRFFVSFPPQVLFLFTLAAGIVMLRQ